MINFVPLAIDVGGNLDVALLDVIWRLNTYKFLYIHPAVIFFLNTIQSYSFIQWLH